MNILVTGSKGFIGKNLVRYLRSNSEHNIFEFSREDLLEDLEKIINKIDIVFHLAGLNKKTINEDFKKGNYNLTKKLCKVIEKNINTKIYYASSIQAEKNNEYGRSKKECENILIKLNNFHKNKIAILRLPGIFGMGCKPNYNSVVATFCFNVLNKIELNIIEPNKEIELVYIEDLCEQLAFLIENNDFQSIYIKIDNINKVNIDYLAKKIKNFQKISNPSSIKNDLETKLYKTYLSYKKL
ncbi:NAD-dependent epimerase/dehydratase family protein [uncultured Prochlorococcus sp.]|uniref:NAD-dependent epimerase/dehydratase family protein n=1 Tax=uncultured Prochlorococcus sp. TaxID=159733 RepID=UPI002584A843|nr:NAD-dependent epimerase/dehydratase family protein [uncultured Prochlorococcus sp.]